MSGVASAPSLSIPEFVARWHGAANSERAAAQSHFIDLCDLLGQPRPAAVDHEGTFYTFEKGVQKTSGGHGFADVWLRGHFAWEYKKPRADLVAAYRQLLNYWEDLENPPLLVVCDFDRFEVHTNYTNTVSKVYAFALADPLPLAGATLSALAILRALFTDPDQLRPQQTTAQVTEAAAREFAQLAISLHNAGNDPEQAAHFLMRLLFCLFAEDIELLPPQLFTRLVEGTRERPAEFGRRLRALFGAMAQGGFFGADDIAHFNGGLFADDAVLGLTRDDLNVLARACRLNWASIEPAIFGTLFERSLDPAKRAQLGTHYTSREDILLIVEPVLMAPLRREWGTVQGKAQPLLARIAAARQLGASTTRVPRDYNDRIALRKLLTDFGQRIAQVHVLDPACGSGNFLYVALKQLMDLEKEVITFATRNGLTSWFPQVQPEQLYGIELNAYAHELAQVVVWIGYLQWLHDNGFATASGTILRRLNNIRQGDAVLGRDEQGRPAEPAWPRADAIIGNLPFLGGKRLRSALGGEYVDALFALYDGRVPREADLVTYWFARARARIAEGEAKRAGLLATNSIRGGANRRVLERVKESGDIFMAWADRPWVLEGAAVRVSMLGFDDGSECVRTLDGAPAASINADLTGALDLTAARRLPENQNVAFMGDTKGGSFDIADAVARRMLSAPLNPNGRPNRDVVRPWVNGLDVTRRPRGMWIIDFGVDMPEAEAALYELPFEHVLRTVQPERASSKTTRLEWWLHERPRVDLRAVIAPLARYIGTARVAKHRLFVWFTHPTLPDSQVIVIARDDDYAFGVLHSKLHELWALRMGTSLEDRPRYTPTTTFETFPFPWPLGREPAGDPRVEAVARAARELATKRAAWLNPPEAADDELQRRTLTNLYNTRPAWLAMAHRTLDRAVLDAYDWPDDLTDEDILARLLALNLERAGGAAEAAKQAVGIPHVLSVSSARRTTASSAASGSAEHSGGTTP